MLDPHPRLGFCPALSLLAGFWLAGGELLAGPLTSNVCPKA
jgi:hypothetical protein